MVMAAVVVSTLVVFTRPSGVFRGAVNRILWMSTDQVNFAVNSLCIGPGCGSTCGDGTCSVADGEICFDPASPAPGACQLDCGLCPMCPDGTCDFGETCVSCPADCGPCPPGPCNHDSICDAGENYLICPDCAMPDCGNGMPNAGEQCDTGEFVGGLTDFFGQVCSNFIEPVDNVNYYDSCGFLVCNPYATGPGVQCTVDTINCCWCGDGFRNGTEECEGGDLGGMDCFQLGILLGINYTGGNLKCLPDGDPQECHYDTSECWVCGDGSLQLGEDCEPSLPITQMCVPYGEKAAECYPPGDPLECQFDFRNCDYCGDDTINGPEVCDGTDLNGESCQSRGYDCGGLACLGDCTGFNESNCNECGDDAVNCPGEECDGSDMGALPTCADHGLPAGTLNCFLPGHAQECKYDTSACGVCGDGVASSPEECDPGPPLDMAGEDCTTLGMGFTDGALQCFAVGHANECEFDTSKCTTCGDGTQEPPYEECDGSDIPASAQCEDYDDPPWPHDYHGGNSLLACDANCDIDPSGCWYCGDGSINGWETCEPGNLNGAHCSDMGAAFHGPDTLIQCNNCTLDYSNCYECGNNNCEPGEQTTCPADCGCRVRYHQLNRCNACNPPPATLYCEARDAAWHSTLTQCEYVEYPYSGQECACGPGTMPSGSSWTWDPAEPVVNGDCEAGIYGEETYDVARGYTCVAVDPVENPPDPCCGDGYRNGSEECEDVDLGPGITQCSDLPAYHSGSLSCYAADKYSPDPNECKYNTSDCKGCGDGNIDDPPEECDPAAAPPIPTDQDECSEHTGYSGSGTVLCNNVTCQIDLSNCDMCGDGNATGSEECDSGNPPAIPPDFNGAHCDDVSPYHGDETYLQCIDCTLDYSNCQYCGDGEINGPEDCDPTASPPVSASNDQCTEHTGYYGSGAVTCNGDCTFNMNNCEYCGDGIISGPENCDNSASPAVPTDEDECEDHAGYLGSGGVTCTASCTFDMSACGLCGDFVLDEAKGEECDTVLTLMGSPIVDFGSHACTDVGCYAEGGMGTAMQCVKCKIDYSKCPCCGDGKLQMALGLPLEECDPGLPDGNCNTLTVGIGQPAYGPGPLTCRPKGDPLGECTWDRSQCTCIGSDSLDGNAAWCTDNHSSVAGQNTTLVDDQGNCSGNECEAYCVDGPPNYVVHPGGGLGPPPYCENACGNGKIDSGETCDPPDYGGVICDDAVGKEGNASKLQCINNCTEIDFSNCDDTCGDLHCELDEGENCDTCPEDCGDCSTATCVYYAYDTYWMDDGTSSTEVAWNTFPDPEGMVYSGSYVASGEVCSTKSRYMRSGGAMDVDGTKVYTTVCRYPVMCGDGSVDCDEVCDKGGIDGVSPNFDTYCRDYGPQYYWTTNGLVCSEDCLSVDYSGCGYCGDGTVQKQFGGEDCEPSPLDLNGGTCENNGYDGGVLACDADCDYNFSACIDLCPGDKPDHSSLCPAGGGAGVTVAVNECTGSKCQYLCDPGYVTIDGLTCVDGCYTYKNEGDCNADPGCEWFSRPEDCQGPASNDCFFFTNPSNCIQVPGCVWSGVCTGTYDCSALDGSICTGVGGEFTHCTYLDPIDICVQNTGGVWDCRYQANVYDWNNTIMLNTTRIHWGNLIPKYNGALIGYWMDDEYYYMPGALMNVVEGATLFFHHEVCRKPITK